MRWIKWVSFHCTREKTQIHLMVRYPELGHLIHLIPLLQQRVGPAQIRSWEVAQLPIESGISLDVLLADPTVVSALSAEHAGALLKKLSSVQTLLVDRLAAGGSAAEEVLPSVSTSDTTPPLNRITEDLVTVDDAATMLRVSPRWLYRHARTLPFARKLSRKVLRFSRSGIVKWLATKRL